jgi:large subunit ribosomal protein L5
MATKQKKVQETGSSVYSSRLKDLYESKFSSELQKELQLKNKFEAPKLLKVVVSMGVKEAAVDSKVMDKVVEDLWLITGQKPIVTKAKKSIAAFKLREGSPIGCAVTLRNNMMYDFVDRFINWALPRVKDFRGLSAKKFDGRGNYAVGIKEHIIFPEINFDKVDKIRGMNIVFVTSAKTNEQALALLKKFNFPFNG